MCIMEGQGVVGMLVTFVFFKVVVSIFCHDGLKWC